MLSEHKIIAALHESLEQYFRVSLIVNNIAATLTAAEQREIVDYLEAAINALQEQDDD